MHTNHYLEVRQACHRAIGEYYAGDDTAFARLSASHEDFLGRDGELLARINAPLFFGSRRKDDVTHDYAHQLLSAYIASQQVRGSPQLQQHSVNLMQLHDNLEHIDYDKDTFAMQRAMLTEFSRELDGAVRLSPPQSLYGDDTRLLRKIATPMQVALSGKRLEVNGLLADKKSTGIEIDQYIRDVNLDKIAWFNAYPIYNAMKFRSWNPSLADGMERYFARRAEVYGISSLVREQLDELLTAEREHEADILDSIHDHLGAFGLSLPSDLDHRLKRWRGSYAMPELSFAKGA